MRLSKPISLAVIALGAGASAFPASSVAAPSLSGAGSTLVAPIVAEWGAAFQAFQGTTVSYFDSGSQKGISEISARAVDFAGSDAPLSASQAAACNSCYQIPWALSAIGVSYNVSGIGRLDLTGSALAQIYLGQISRWNDPRIKALNPRLALPNLKITPISENSSGGTYTFTSYLSKVSKSWRTKVGAGLTVAFPAGLSVSTNSDATALLKSTNGAIAYIGAPYLLSNKLPAAAIENAAGRFEYPNLSEIEAAAQTIKHVPAGNALGIVDPPSSARTAYPISTFSYAIVPSNATQKSLLTQWISYAIGAGQQFGPALDFAALPSVVKRASEATLSSFSRS